MQAIDQTVIINYLKKHKSELHDKYAIHRIGLFGSFATDKFNQNSDIAIVYETTSKGLTLSQLSTLEDELSTVFEKDIDLVNFKYMNPLIKRKVLKDIIYV